MKYDEFFEAVESKIEDLDHRPLRNLSRVFTGEFAANSGYVEGIDVITDDGHDELMEFENREIDSEKERAYCALAGLAGCLTGAFAGVPFVPKRVYDSVKS